MVRAPGPAATVTARPGRARTRLRPRCRRDLPSGRPASAAGHSATIPPRIKFVQPDRLGPAGHRRQIARIRIALITCGLPASDQPPACSPRPSALPSWRKSHEPAAFVTRPHISAQSGVDRAITLVRFARADHRPGGSLCAAGAIPPSPEASTAARAGRLRTQPLGPAHIHSRR